MVLYGSVKNAAVNASRLKFEWVMIELWDGVSVSITQIVV